MRRLMLPFVSADDERSATIVVAERGFCGAGARAFGMGDDAVSHIRDVNTASGYAPALNAPEPLNVNLREFTDHHFQ